MSSFPNLHFLRWLNSFIKAYLINRYLKNVTGIFWLLWRVSYFVVNNMNNMPSTKIFAKSVNFQSVLALRHNNEIT